MSERHSGILRSTVHVTFISLLGIGAGFGLQIATAFYFGATAERDAYFAAATIPTFLVAVFTGSLGVMLLPVYVRLRRISESDAQRFFAQAFGIALFGLLVAALLGAWQADTVIRFTAIGFDAVRHDIAARLLRVLAFTMLFQGASSLLTSLLNADRRFIIAAFAPVVGSLCTLVFVFLLNRDYGIMSVAIGSLVGSVAGSLMLVAACKQTRHLARWFDRWSGHLGRYIQLCLPLLVGGVLFRSTTVFERMLGSTLDAGGLSFLGYAGQLTLSLAFLTAGGIATTLYPVMSEDWAKGNQEGFHNLTGRGIRNIAVICAGIIAVILALGNPIINVIFEHGAFTSTATQGVSSTLAVLTGTFLFSSLGAVCGKIFYVLGRTKTAAFIATVEIVVYIVLGFALAPLFSYMGIAAASSISSGLNIGISFGVLILSGHKAILRSLVAALPTLLLALLLSTASMLWLHTFLSSSWNYHWSLAICLTVGIGVYTLVLVYRDDIDDVRDIKDRALSWLGLSRGSDSAT